MNEPFNDVSEFPPEHRDELDERLDELEANPGEYLTWEQLLQRVVPTTSNRQD